MSSNTSRIESVQLGPAPGVEGFRKTRDRLAMSVRRAKVSRPSTERPCPAPWPVALALILVQPADAQTPDPQPAPAQYTDADVRSGTVYRYTVESKTGDDYRATPRFNPVNSYVRTGAPQRDGVNLLVNGSFENGSSGWDVWGGAAVIEAEASDGQFSVRVTQHNGAEQRVNGLLPNSRYTLTGLGKVTGPNAMTIGVKDHGNNEERMEFTGADYTTKSFSFTTGFSSTSATVYVYKYAGMEAGYGDNVVLAGGTGPELTLVWSEEFNGRGAVDSSKWGFEHGFMRNREVQWYQAGNAFQENGHLVIEGRRETFANPDYVAGSGDWRTSRELVNYTSASLFSRQQWQYSTIVVRAKVTNRTGTWPAIWTLGASCEWPSNGEVDIMENYGGNILANFAWGTGTRWEPVWDSSSRAVDSLGPNWSEDFHIWELNWDENRMSIYLDGILLNDRPLTDTINGSAACEGQNPFRQPHYLLLNLALGGAQGGSVDNLTFPTRYLVDYVRVYSRYVRVHSKQPEQRDQSSPPREEPVARAPIPPSGHPVSGQTPPEDDPTDSEEDDSTNRGPAT